jgi:hypothetical protein
MKLVGWLVGWLVSQSVLRRNTRLIWTSLDAAALKSVTYVHRL